MNGIYFTSVKLLQAFLVLFYFLNKQLLLIQSYFPVATSSCIQNNNNLEASFSEIKNS